MEIEQVMVTDKTNAMPLTRNQTVLFEVLPFVIKNQSTLMLEILFRKFAAIDKDRGPTKEIIKGAIEFSGLINDGRFEEVVKNLAKNYHFIKEEVKKEKTELEDAFTKMVGTKDTPSTSTITSPKQASPAQTGSTTQQQ